MKQKHSETKMLVKTETPVHAGWGFRPYAHPYNPSLFAGRYHQMPRGYLVSAMETFPVIVADRRIRVRMLVFFAAIHLSGAYV